MNEPTAIATVADVMSEVVALFTSIMEMVADVADLVISNPLILTFVIVGLAFTGINMFRRFLSL